LAFVSKALRAIFVTQIVTTIVAARSARRKQFAKEMTLGKF
jgi:hypothetical protein